MEIAIPTTLLRRLRDVVITSPAAGDVPTYDGSKWVNQPGGGGGGLTATDNNTLFVQFANTVSIPASGPVTLSFSTDGGSAVTALGHALPGGGSYAVDTVADTYTIKDAGIYAWSISGYFHAAPDSPPPLGGANFQLQFLSAPATAVDILGDLAGNISGALVQLGPDYASQGASDAYLSASGTMLMPTGNQSGAFTVSAGGGTIVADGVYFHFWKIG